MVTGSGDSRFSSVLPGDLRAPFSFPQARVNVPDDRFKWLCETYKPKSEVPAFLEIVDIAGLVRHVQHMAVGVLTEDPVMAPC